MRPVSLFLPAASALLFLCACGGGADSNKAREDAIEQAGKRHGFDVDATVSEDGKTEKIEVRQGAATMGRNLDRPADFPDDIHVPSNWEIMAFSPVPPAGYSIQAMTDESAGDIVKELSREMAANGWTPAKEGPMQRAGFEKGKRLATYTIVSNGERNTVQVMTLTLP